MVFASIILVDKFIIMLHAVPAKENDTPSESFVDLTDQNENLSVGETMDYKVIKVTACVCLHSLFLPGIAGLRRVAEYS